MPAILVHFRPEQKRRLTRRAKFTGRSVSEEIREAVDLYLELPAGDREQLEALAAEANKSLERTLRRLEKSIHTVDEALRKAGGGK